MLKMLSINYSLMNFNFLITIFILNLFYIAIIQSNYQKERVMNLSIQDYTLLIINLTYTYDTCISKYPE